ncbi:hypothetical protein ACJMK2_037773 [Sinanodonta woodiana]|uniref:E3 ubiquitin-protein ligase n=1 Tax=Sinanodonta woodiana TaxID=1069815 RepID=A0ABD3WQQ4_SINWO
MALRTLLQTPEFCQKTLIQEWLSCYQQGDLLTDLKKHWKVFVLVVYQHSQNVEDPNREERLAEKFLFQPMENFLCNGNSEEVFQKLKECDQPSTLCGHVFKGGEPIYSCRDCANDPTCVLCIECFQKSAHRKHRYRMSTSGGGGYCDCGDPEAWKSEAFCDSHRKGLSGQGEMNPVDLLPVDLSDRASALFSAVLKYAVEMLTWEQCETLPEGLEVDGPLDDTYICMLFNDEVHTYEQVITALQRAIDCTHKQAVDMATIVDREGRSSVLSGGAESCKRAKEIIERNTSRHNNKPLKVQVMHSTVVAHQQFALRIIQWLQGIIAKSDGLRRLFCLLSMIQQESGQSLMEILLLKDTQLWKNARVQSHQLMMAGVLMDQECKKKFSVIFTKFYPKFMEDFCRDDHDHDVSVASLSVQIFTVPSLARMLVTEHNLLSVILETFLEACCREKRDTEGKLVFERNVRGQSFKRACYTLHDLKYALVCRPNPDEWTPALRQSFLKGLESFLNLLSLMEDMNSVKRQTGQHLEYEPEWEGAFNLQLKLEDNISLFLNWCGSDRQVLIEAYNKSLEVFQKCKKFERSKKEYTVAGHSVRCIKYDVSKDSVSIHLPVTRFLAGLHISLGKFGLEFESPNCHLMKPDPVELMENPLQCQVLVAQSQAGMWRRNGYSLLNQIFFYQNVKCRTEMFDKDIVMLQVAAAIISSDEFLIHLLQKFGLMQWVKHDYDIPSGQEDSVRQTIILSEEFLDLLIVILSERYVPGIGEVTDADRVRREVIHQLCLSAMAHSELTKALPEDVNNETGLEDVVNDVAIFKKSSGLGKGRYELKPEYYEHYNPYFYHYTKQERSKSEELQSKRKKENGENQALHPPVPVQFCPQFKSSINLLQCDVMIYIMALVLGRSTAVRSRSFSENQLERVLHLIGLALHEQKRALELGFTGFDFYSKAIKALDSNIKGSGDGRSILELLESLVGSPNISHESLRDFLSWVLKVFSEVRQMKNLPASSGSLDQLSSDSDVKMEVEKKKKAEKAAKRRAKLMAQMSTMQKNFIRENSELFENTSTELIPRTDSDMDLSDITNQSYPIAVGQRRSIPPPPQPARGTCILCQEEQDIIHNGRVMVLTAFIQKSTVLSQSRGKVLLKGEEHDPLFMTSDLYTGTHTGSCGHSMHADCWQRYFDAVLARERRRPLRLRHNFSYDIDKLEFLCPLCGCLSNTVIPILPPLSTLRSESTDEKKEVQLTFPDWLDGIHKTVQKSIKEAEQDKETKEDTLLFQPCPLSAITKLMAESVARNFQLLWGLDQVEESGQFSHEMQEMLKKFARDVYSFGLGVEPDDDNPRVPILAWHSCAFTIHSTEQLLRDEEKPLFGALSTRQADCLKALVKFAATCSQGMSTETVREHCVRLLSVLFPDVFEGRKTKDATCFLDLDMFHYLTILVMALPSLYAEGTSSASDFQTTLPSGGLKEQHAIQLVLTVHLIQVLLSFDSDNCGMEVEGDYEGEALLIIYDKLKMMANINLDKTPLPWQLSVYVRKAMLPFLRCTALLFHYITQVPPPAELQESREDEFDYVCRYLGLHTHMSRLLESQQGEAFDSFVSKLCKSKILQERFTASNQPILRYPLSINRLIELPEDYSELINKVSTFTCPKSDGDDSRAPTMCLVCGKMLCSQSYCCQTEFMGVTMGAATEHAYLCGAGSGVFLRVRECQILLLAGKTRGCFVPPPYLDIYGETDQGLRRGNPLHLCTEGYRNLQRLWMTHAIPETVAHNLESNAHLLTIDWQHL